MCLSPVQVSQDEKPGKEDLNQELGKERVDLYLPRPASPKKIKKKTAPPPTPAPGPIDGYVVPSTARTDGGEADCDEIVIRVIKRKCSPEIAITKDRHKSKVKINNAPNTRVSQEDNAQSKSGLPVSQDKDRDSAEKVSPAKEETKEELHTPDAAPQPSSPPPMTTPFSAGAASSSKDKEFFQDKTKVAPPPKPTLGSCWHPASQASDTAELLHCGFATF